MTISTTSKTRWTCLTTAVAVGALCLVAPASANGSESGPDVVAAPTLEQLIATGALEYRDPSSGEIVSATPERVTALREDLAPLFDRPQVHAREVRADGTVQVFADGHGGHVYLTRLNIDGSRSFSCVETLDGAVTFMIGADTHRAEHVHTRLPVVD